MATTNAQPTSGPTTPVRQKGKKRKSLVTGLKRHRCGGTWRKLGGGQMAVPDQRLERMAEGFRLPDAPATPKQLKTLDNLITQYLRFRVVHEYLGLGLPPDVIAKVLGLKERTGYNLVNEFKDLSCHPDAWMVIMVLDGMAKGELPGVLATRKTATMQYLFQVIHY